MDAEQAGQFLSDCNEIFGFAVRDYGFSPGELERVLGQRGAYVHFMGSRLSLRCSWDSFERYGELDFFRLQDGKRSRAAVDEAGRWLQTDIETLLKSRRVRRSRDIVDDLGGPKTRSNKKLLKWEYSLDERVLWRWYLTGHARDLRDFAEDVLRNETACFDERAEPCRPEPAKRPKLP